MRIGFIGLGRMGANMVRRLTRDGHEIVKLLSRFRERGTRGRQSWLRAVTRAALVEGQLELANRGFTPELGVEETLTQRAVADGKPITGLETPEEQFGAIGGLPLPQQNRMLLMTLEETAQLDTEIDALLAAWRSGDVEALAKTLSAEYDRFPELYGPLTENRNRAWLPQLVSMLDDDDDYLVVVGALHLVGRNSVIDLLEQRGYEVEQQ